VIDLRPIESRDLKVTKSFTCSSGKIRTFVSVKGASFVNKTYWLSEQQLREPETLEQIKRDLAGLLKKKAKAIWEFQSIQHRT
jgi:hypothetical protein